MGAWDSKVKQAETDTEERERIRWEILGDERAHSPEPSIPPPSNFISLPIEEQFAYLKPILKSILNGKFDPAKQRHEGFIKGGTERSAVTKAAGIRGDLDDHTISILSAYICRWVLRDDTFIKRPPRESSPAQGTENIDDASSAIATVSSFVIPRVTYIYSLLCQGAAPIITLNTAVLTTNFYSSKRVQPSSPFISLIVILRKIQRSYRLKQKVSENSQRCVR